MTDSWKSRAKCSSLSPKEADALFFVGRGGKSKKAKQFCNNCPVESECLMSAIQEDLEGFYAGTTKAERMQMAFFRHITVMGLNLPPEPDPETPTLLEIIEQYQSDTIGYLDNLNPPDSLFIAS